MEQGAFLQEASQLVVWDTLQSEGGDRCTHCTEVRQVTECDSESTHSCERSKYRITLCVCVCVCVCVCTSESEGEADGKGISFRDGLLLVARSRTLVPLFLQ